MVIREIVKAFGHVELTLRCCRRGNPSLLLNLQDFGMSPWHLTIEGYTNLSHLGKGANFPLQGMHRVTGEPGLSTAIVISARRRGAHLVGPTERGERRGSD
jgi:hypothetical protein